MAYLTNKAPIGEVRLTWDWGLLQAQAKMANGEKRYRVSRHDAKQHSDSAMAFDDLSDCDICGGSFGVKSECRPNLELEHAIRPAPAFLPSA